MHLSDFFSSFESKKTCTEFQHTLDCNQSLTGLNKNPGKCGSNPGTFLSKQIPHPNFSDVSKTILDSHDGSNETFIELCLIFSIDKKERSVHVGNVRGTQPDTALPLMPSLVQPGILPKVPMDVRKNFQNVSSFYDRRFVFKNKKLWLKRVGDNASFRCIG